ncbi:MAG: DNA replication and repair protein RecF [Ferruginibacter sp.]
MSSPNSTFAILLNVHKISITQYRNYTFSSFDFKERVVGICGMNGRGKTNLLDAVYYCCFTKSYFSKPDAMNVQFGADGFRIEADIVLNNESQQVICINRGQGKKEFSLNGIAYEKFSQHIGKFPCVMIAPDDIELITGGSEERRKFIDTVLSQYNSEYLQQLIIYGKVLQQRNSLLKRFAELGHTDWPLLEVLDEQMISPGNFIHQKRKEFAATLIPLVQAFYQTIASANSETITLQYESQLNEMDFNALLNNYRQKDFILQRSNAGTHKDDLLLQLDGKPFKTTASQGQRKSLLFAMKLAEFEILKSRKGFAPLLLLDDGFEKLDNLRMNNLLNWVCNENDGQVLITDTHRERLVASFQELKIDFGMIEL